MTEIAEKAPRPRLTRVDLARGLALIAMAIYHFGWDLEFFGYMEPGTTAVGGWKLFARCIASSFLFLVGFSLVLANGRGVRWPAVRKRFLQIAAAAAAISAVTWYISPDSFIFFGILHQIALASLLGLLFLRLPAPLTALAAALVIAAPLFARSAIFDHPALAWVGLSTVLWRSNDYVPLFPWFGAVLLGIAAARLFERFGLMRLLAGENDAAARPLTFLGRHSLAFYLIHQPVLMSLVYAFSHLFPGTLPIPQARFESSCVASCRKNADETVCRSFCGCVVSELQKAKLFDDAFAGRIDQRSDTRIQDIASMCTPLSDGEPEAP